jgi:ABC-type phosphate transport system permease subunit
MENDSNEPQKPKGSPLIALLLGFAPAAILIAVFSGVGLKLPSAEQNMFLWSACIVSIVCCFVSSAMLFRRGTGGAIAGAFLLMLLNAFIAFFFGCCASINFH